MFVHENENKTKLLQTINTIECVNVKLYKAFKLESILVDWPFHRWIDLNIQFN